MKKFLNIFLVLSIFVMYLPVDAEAAKRKVWKSKSRSSGGFFSKSKSKTESNSNLYEKRKKAEASRKRQAELKKKREALKKKQAERKRQAELKKKREQNYNGNTQAKKDSRTKQQELAKKREALKAKNAAKNSPPKKSVNGFGSTKKMTGKTDTSVKAVKGNNFDQARTKKITKQKNKKAMADYKKEKLKFKGDRKTAKSGKTIKTKPVTKVTVKQKTVYKTRYVNVNRGSYYGRNSYYDRRSRYYDDFDYHHRPYIYNHSSSFGMWDAVFMWALLDSIGSSNSHASQHVYHHQNDPGVQQWMQAAREEARENEELRMKLENMDREIAQMKTQGVPVDDAYLPEDVDPDIAFDPEFVEENSDMFYNDDMSQLDELDQMIHPSNFE